MAAATTNSGNAEEFLYGGQNEAEQPYVVPAIQRVTRQNNTLPIWKSSETMNLNHLILENIHISPYFKNKLSTLTKYHEVIDELYYSVGHLEPWERGTHKTAGQTGMCGGVRGVGAGGVVSTPFCIMFKLFTMKLFRKQLVAMINHADSPYIRALGFMYIRFCQPPETFWEWYEPYFDDEEEVDPKAGGGDNMTMGQLVKLLLTKLDWYGTLFPRIPVPVQKELDQKLREYNMKKFEEAKRERDAKEAAEKQKSESDVVRRDERRSPRRYESRGREKSSERGGSGRRSRSRSKQSASGIKRSHSRSKHSRHRASSRSRHRDRRSRSRSPKHSKTGERQSERKRSRSKSRDSKRHRSGDGHKHRKHRHHHRHHRSHRSRHESDKNSHSMDKKEGSRKRRSKSPEEQGDEKRVEETRTENNLPPRGRQEAPSSSSERSANNGNRDPSQEPRGGSRQDDDVKEEGELVDEPTSEKEER